MVRRFIVAALAIGFAFSSLTASSLFAQSPAGRREIRVGVPGVPDSIEPGSALEGPGALIARQVFDTLVAYRESSTDIEPSLATRWAVSRDGLVWNFILRDNVHFHDGKALTAADAVSSLERPLKVGTRPAATVWTALLRGAPGVVREVRVAGPRTVQFVLHQPYAPLLTVLAHPGFGVAREASGADGASRLVGTGPYRLTEATAGRIVLDAVPGHWAGPPRVERLVFLDVGTDDHAEAEFDASALDIWFPPGPPRRQQGTLSIPGPRVGFLAFQTEREPFSRKRIRQAIAAGIDPGILGVALDAAAVPLQSYLPAGVWARREGSPVLGGTRQTVATLLKQGQWPSGFTPTLVASAEGGSVDVGVVADALRLSLATAGIPVKIRLEAPEVAAAARATGDHDMTLAEAPVLGGDPHLFLYPLSTSEGTTTLGRPAFNFSFYRDPRLDDMLIRASQLAFRPERQRLYQRAQAVLADEMPWLPLYVRLQWAVTRPEVRGLRLHPTGFHRLSTVILESAGPAPASNPSR
jgi:peptide/nickel transport system substrate-binding protein